jgi:hypothetical protein
MRLQPADPDIRTLVDRIRDGSIDLQPDFQRGLVWPLPKQQKLIDSVLRDWHIPPVHLIRDKRGDEVVLDGQQRLEAIRAFVGDEFAVDGTIEPADPEIAALDGLRFSALPEKSRRRVERFTIRVFTIIDYTTKEPFELFYRLNQPMALTASEQRNAFFGRARAQIRSLVELAESEGLQRDRIGFSNSRMAYDDVFARFCLTLEVGDLRAKITSAGITEIYRSEKGFSNRTVDVARSSLMQLLSLPALQEGVRLNKATLYSWLCFFSSLQADGASIKTEILSNYISLFETARTHVRVLPIGQAAHVQLPSFGVDESGHLLRIYNDRASARVADVSSVLLRDLILWLGFAGIGPAVRRKSPRATKAWSLASPGSFRDAEQELLLAASESDWGSIR